MGTQGSYQQGDIASTTSSTPTKLADNLTHIPIDIPIAAICAIVVIFNERGDFYTTVSFLMMMNHHSLDLHSRLDFYAHPSSATRGGG
jgi:hypothetical protein